MLLSFQVKNKNPRDQVIFQELLKVSDAAAGEVQGVAGVSRSHDEAVGWTVVALTVVFRGQAGDNHHIGQSLFRLNISPVNHYLGKSSLGIIITWDNQHFEKSLVGAINTWDIHN